MKQLLKYLKNYKKETILAPLFKMLEAGFELFVPLVMASMIDIGIPNQDSAYIWKMGAILLALGVIGLVCSITAQFFAAKAAVGFGTELRRDLFAHINKLNYAEIDTIGTSTLLTRITSDTNQVQTGVNLVLRLFLRSPFIVFGAMVMAFTIDVKAAFWFVIAIPLLSIVVFGIMYLTMPLYKNVQKKLDIVLLRVRENLAGARVIRAFNRQESEMEVFANDSRELMGLQLFVGKISALLNPITYVIINLAIVALLWSGGNKVFHGSLPQGEVVALVNYMSQILVELIKLANLIVVMAKAAACANRITEVFQTETDMAEGSVKAEEISDLPKEQVVFDKVSFAYKNAKENSLEDISFTANRGETIGIIGGTGSGKSTLVNLIPRFYDATKGSIRIDGRKIEDYTYEALRTKIGVVPQKAVLFSGTIYENMCWGKKDATKEEVNEALEIAQAKEFVEAKQDGIYTKLTQGGKNLSGGQRQRLTIARALVSKPEILILDDSASALDFATDAKLRKAIHQMEGDTTVFIVSQRAASIKQADKILVLEDGNLVGIGTHKELLETCEVYQEICLSQFSKEEIASELAK